MADRELSAESITHAQGGSPSKRDRTSTASKRSRGRSGCLNCRRRRKKCDEGKPACAKCTTHGEVCEWDTRITFRLSGIGTYHPSMVYSRNLKTHSDYQIVHVTIDENTSCAGSSQNIRKEQPAARSQDIPSLANEKGGWSMQERRSETLRPLIRVSDTLSIHNATMAGSSENHPSTRVIETSPRVDFSDEGLAGLTPASQTSNKIGNVSPIFPESDTATFPFSLPPISAATPTIEMTDLPPEAARPPRLSCLNPFNGGTGTGPKRTTISSGLESLDYLTSQPYNVGFAASVSQQQGSLQCYPNSSSDLIDPSFATESGLAESPDLHTHCYSDVMYQDLHTTLYHHMVETARNTALTRQTSPNPFVQEVSHTAHSPSPSPSNIGGTRTQTRESTRFQPLKSAKLSQQRQLQLWRNYLDEIAIWLDMFDSDRHFQFSIPLLAKSADHLQYSILALSARQLERKQPDKPYTESLGLYQEAIQLIVNELYSLDTTVIASCVLLCVLEMMSSSPKAWCRHLNGCAMLLEAAGVNGVVGGVRQSLFWCFARMGVWGGFLEDTLTKIPTSRWFVPRESMIKVVTHFRAGPGSHSYANYAVFLCASVVNVISNKNGTYPGHARDENARKTTFSARWNALFDLLEDWYNNRPEEMQPLIAYPSNSEDLREPFSVLLYSSSPAVNGNQLYHAAALLLLQNKPKCIRLSKSPKSILWHARQICGIAISNSDHGARINSLQPLWIAGKIMSHESEHRAILDLLEQIERDTGWATAWRAQDLKDYWGNAERSDTY